MSITDLWVIVNKNTEMQISRNWWDIGLCAYKYTCGSNQIKGDSHQDGKRHVADLMPVTAQTDTLSPAGGEQEVPHRSKPSVSSCTENVGKWSYLYLAVSMNILFRGIWPPYVALPRDSLTCDDKKVAHSLLNPDCNYK